MSLVRIGPAAAARSRLALFAAALALVCGGGSVAPSLSSSSPPVPFPAPQASTAPAVRASFLFSFARFTEWPADVLTPDAPIKLCVGDRVVASALESAVSGRTIKLHHLVVLRIAPDSATSSCQVLDLGGMDVEQSRRIVEALRGAPVLTVGDSPRFTAAGGIASARVEDGSVHLTINVMAAERARLRIGAQLLNVAAIVGDAGRDQSHAGRR